MLCCITLAHTPTPPPCVWPTYHIPPVTPVGSHPPHAEGDPAGAALQLLGKAHVRCVRPSPGGEHRHHPRFVPRGGAMDAAATAAAAAVFVVVVVLAVVVVIAVTAVVADRPPTPHAQAGGGGGGAAGGGSGAKEGGRKDGRAGGVVPVAGPRPWVGGKVGGGKEGGGGREADEHGTQAMKAAATRKAKSMGIERSASRVATARRSSTTPPHTPKSNGVPRAAAVLPHE